MTQREKALMQLSAAQFVAWELHLYLDTHPDDENAMSQYEESVEKAKALHCDYEERFGALSQSTSAGREWLKNPWPWDLGTEVW